MLLTPAQISWQQHEPRASAFDDLYFTDKAADGGIDEVRRFFIAPTKILEVARTQPIVTVGELGFGTGLNFCVLAEDILMSTQACLHFVSVEAHPLSYADWQQVKARRSNLTLAARLAQDPLPLLPGWHHRVFANGRIRLSVYHGDALDGLQHWQSTTQAGIDAWFLDGFAPDRNPEMWHQALFDSMAKASTKKANVATFTAAGMVRRNLMSAGFTVTKENREPYKREALVGVIEGERQAANAPTSVNIAGAGIGGCTLARYLADLNVNVRLYDPAGLAQARRSQGASKIRQAVLHARLLAHSDQHTTNPQQRASTLARAHAFHFATHFSAQFDGFSPTGVIQVQGPQMDAAKLQRLIDTYQAKDDTQHWWIRYLTSNEIKAAAQPLVYELGRPGLLFTRGGRIDIPTYCAHLTDHPNIELVSEPAPLTHELTVYCNAESVRHLEGWEHLEISKVGGQLDHYRHALTSTSYTSNPTQDLTRHSTPPALVGNGYCVTEPEQLTLGATYEYRPWTETEATAHNLKLNSSITAVDEDSWLDRTRGTRAVTSDRLPIVGQLDSHHWIATGYGSMGTTMASYAASIIGTQLCGWAPPASQEILAGLAPQRFAARQAKRGLRHGALQDLPDSGPTPHNKL